MAIKDIVVHLDTGEAGPSVSGFAISLAAATDAHLTAAGIAIQYMPTGGMEEMGCMEYLLEITDASRQAAEKAYQNLTTAAPAGVQTEFVLIETYSANARDRFGALARHFDLSVVGRGDWETVEEERLMAAGALFGSGRPVFLVPATHKAPANLARAMICWDGGLTAARALAGAMPLLARAKRVDVVTIAKEGETADDLPSFNIVRHLARHGIHAKLSRLPMADDAGAALLRHAASSSADYMVMGAYGHWRVRELMLGGVTKTVLASMTLPVLMAH